MKNTVTSCSLADVSEETSMLPSSWFKNKPYKLTMHAVWLTLRP
jgi:hypothetical protein